MFSRAFCIRKEKRIRKKNSHTILINGLEVFKTVENPCRLVKPLSSFMTSSSLFLAGAILSLNPFKYIRFKTKIIHHSNIILYKTKKDFY